jgi:hypothetical protein
VAAIAGVVMAIIALITGVRSFCCFLYLTDYLTTTQIFVMIFDIIEYILCCGCFRRRYRLPVYTAGGRSRFSRRRF